MDAVLGYLWPPSLPDWLADDIGVPRGTRHRSVRTSRRRERPAVTERVAKLIRLPERKTERRAA